METGEGQGAERPACRRERADEDARLTSETVAAGLLGGEKSEMGERFRIGYLLRRKSI